MSSVSILLAHPDLAQSRVTRALAQAVEAAASPLLDLRDLYCLYPDYAIDLAQERRMLAQSQMVVLLHPFHWYGMPALLKLWVDEVLKFGWAYGPGGEALRGKTLWLVSSTGGKAESYSAAGHHGHTIETFLLPYQQIARLCGMQFRPPLLLHGAHHTSDADLHQHALSFVQALLGFTNATTDQPPSLPEIELDARPALFSPLAQPGNRR